MASTEIRVNLLFEDNISAVTRRINSLTRSINKLNSAIEQIRGSNGNLKVKVSIDVDDKAIDQLKETSKTMSRAVGNITRSVNRLNSALEQLKNINGNGVRFNISLDGADRTIKQLREINRMINRLKAHQEVRIRVLFDQGDVVRARRIVNYNAIVTADNLQRGRIVINQGIGEASERRRGTSALWGRIGNIAETIGQFGISYAMTGIRFFGVRLPQMVVGIAGNYFKTLVGYQKQAYMWMYNVAKQGIDFLRNNVIEGLKRGVQIIANVGKFLTQVPFKYIGGALLRGITGFYSGAIKLFTGMLQAPFKVLRTAGSIFNEIDRWFRHVSQAFYYVSMTFSYISRTAGLIAGAIVGAVVKIFETFKSAVQEQYKIAVTTGIVATPSSVAGLQGENAAKDVRNKIVTLTKTVYQINQRSGAAFGDIVNLLYFISSSGFKQTEELKNVTEAVSSVAFATGSEPVALFRSLISIMGAEGIEPTERNINSTLAKIVYAVSEGVFEMGELATQLQRVAAFSEAANTSFEETLSIMAALSRGGLKPETIGTGLSQVFVHLNRPQTQEKLRQYLGIVPIKFEEGIMQQQSIMEIIEALVPSELLKRVKSGELTAADREMLKQIAKQSAVVIGFEKRAQTAWLTMFNKLDDVYRMLREFEGMQKTPELLEKYLAYFKEIPNATMLATLNKIAGALEYLKTTVLNAVMNKLGANVDQIVEKVKDFADKIASVVENTNVLSKIFELIKALIRLVIDLITVAVVFGLIATSLRLMAAYFEMIRPTILLLAGFVKGFYSGLSDKHKGDLSKAIENYVAFMLGIGEKLGELFAKLFEVIEEFVNNMNKLKEAGKSSGEATGQAAAEVVVNLSGILADATGTAVKWVNDFTAAFISEFNKKKEELTNNVKNILLNVFAFDLGFFNIALKLVEGFVGGLNKALKISWAVANAVTDVERIRRSYNATTVDGQSKKKLLSELETNAEIDEYVEDVRKQTVERLIKNGFYKTESEIDEATRQAITNFAKSYVLFAKEIPNTVKNIIVDGIEASIFGLDVGLKLLIKILDGMISGLNTIVDKLLKGEYNEILKDIQSDTAQFITKLGAVFMDVAIIGFTVAGELMAGAFKGVETLDKWFESPETKKMRTALADAIKKFFVNSLKFAISGVEFVGEVLNTILPALSEGLDEIVKYLENPSVAKELGDTLTKVMTNVVIFAGKTVKLMLTGFPIFARAFASVLTGKGVDQFEKDVMSKWRGVINTLREYLPTAISGFIDILVFALTLVDDVIVQFENALAKNQEKMVILFTKIFEVMFDIVRTEAEVLKAAVKGFAEVLKNALIPDTTDFKKFQEFKGTVKEIGKTFGESTANLFAAFIEVGGALIKGIAEGLRKADSKIIAKALGDIFKDAVSSSISFMSFGLDVAVELLVKIYNWLNVVLELFRILRDQNAWEQFKTTRKLNIQVAYSQSKEQVEFSEEDIKGLENIKGRLGELKLIIPGLVIGIGDVWWNVVNQITTQLKEVFEAMALYNPKEEYAKQKPEFQKYIKEQDFKNFQDMVANLTQSFSNVLSVVLGSAPIVITKLTFKALEFAFESVNDQTRTGIIAALAAVLTSQIIKVTTANGVLAMTVGVGVFFAVREVSDFIVEHYEDVKNGILTGLQTALNLLGIAGLTFALRSSSNVALILTVGSALSFALSNVVGVTADKSGLTTIGQKVGKAIYDAFPTLAGIAATLATGGNALIGFTVTAAVGFTLKILEDAIKETIGLERFIDAFVAFLKNAFTLALGGALIGFVVGGAPGALIGLTIGLAVSFALNIEDNLEKTKKQIEEEMKKVQDALKKGIEIAKKASGQYTQNVQFFQQVESRVQQRSTAQPMVDAFYKQQLPKYMKSALDFYILRSGEKPKEIPIEAAKWFTDFVSSIPGEFEKVGERVNLWYQTNITQPIKPESILELKGEIPDWFRAKVDEMINANFKSVVVEEFIKAAQMYLEFIPYYLIMRKLKDVKPERRATELQKYLNDVNGFKKDVDTAVANYKNFLKTLINTKIVSSNTLNPELAYDMRRQLTYTIEALQFQYATGGYTGDGGKYEPAGIVHKGEYVIPQWMVKKYPETIATLERIRKRGYQSGGPVDVTVPVSSNPVQRTITDALVDLGREIEVVASALGNIGDKIDTSVISKVTTGEASTKELANVIAQGYTLLSDFSKPIWGMYSDIPALVKNVSTDLDEINRLVLGISEDLRNVPGKPTITTTTTPQGKKLTEVTGDIKEILITSAASVFLGQEAGSMFSSFILPFFKDLKGSPLEHIEETQDEIKKYKFTNYGIPGLGELADILLSFGNWADKLVSDEMLKQYRSMYIYPYQPEGIKGGEGKFESIGDKLIKFLNDFQQLGLLGVLKNVPVIGSFFEVVDNAFGTLKSLPVVGTYFAAVGNIFGMLGQRMPGIVKNLITFVYNLESVQKAFSPINTIIEAATEVLKPFIDEAMQPLIEVWQMIGRYIGMALIPIVQIFGGLLKVLMVIFQPVVDAFRLVGKVVFIAGKVVLMVFTKVANAIIDVFNFVIGVINSALGWLGINLSTLQKLQEESWEDILKQADELFASTTLGASSGGSGGVGVTSRAENITYNNYITVNFEDMVIADKEKFKQFLIETLQELGLSVGK